MIPSRWSMSSAPAAIQEAGTTKHRAKCGADAPTQREVQADAPSGPLVLARGPAAGFASCDDSTALRYRARAIIPLDRSGAYNVPWDSFIQRIGLRRILP